MIAIIVAYLGVNGLVLAGLFHLKKDQSAFVWVIPLVTYIAFIHYIGRRSIKQGKAYDDILRQSYRFSFAIAYIMGIGGGLLMSLAEGQGYAGLFWAISTGWLGGLLACLPAMVLVNQFFGDTNKPPNQAL